MNILSGEVIDFLESLAPLHLQEDYDNSGLLIGSSVQVVKGVMICLDCTEEVLDEAIKKGCNLVISHHPPIFYGVKKLTGSNMTERIIEKAIRHDLILYAIHTNLDNTLSNGVNEQIARKLGLEIDGILRPMAGNPDPMIGAGLLGYFPDPMTEAQFLKRLKDRMKTGVIRHSALIHRPIQKVALCGGSGSFLIEDAKKAGVEAFVTADIKYHHFFDADGVLLVCDIGHYESEQFTVELLQSLISRNFPTFAAHCTGYSTNPVQYFT
ncbi:MAG TPA: Nif3-like dinuclear metal center hexameric protein [Saprospiraceae bacterium]|nr:Nif3-like dinuclear metal center hexameric protein [Saprospiraceae bacterium]